MSSYDPVNYSDKDHIHTPSDGHYSDDPHDGGRQMNGNGIYNDYTVKLTPKAYNPTLKFLCWECKNTKRVKFVMCSACVVFCLALILVIVSAVAHHHEQSNQKKQTKEYGLMAYGPDQNGMINFDHLDHKSYMAYFNRMEAALHDYDIVKQEAQLETKYIKCTDNMTSIPEGKVCMLHPIHFGENCQHITMYGIIEERPCVLLVLKLEKDFMPVLFNFTDTQNAEIHRILGDRISNTSVGVSCDGKTDEDKKHIGRNKQEGEPFDFHPREGFPLYYFLSKDTDGYINPAVMVQFNTLPTRQTVTIKCTAWAENFNNEAPQTSPKYSTEFTFDLK